MSTRTLSNREALSERVSALAKDFEDVSVATKRMATDSVDTIRDATVKVLDEGRTKIRKAGESVEGKIQQQPVKTMLIAAGIGFLAGVLFARR